MYPINIPPATKLSGSASEDFLFYSIDLKCLVRIDYCLTNRIGLLLEGQYSRGLTNIANNSEFSFAFNNYSAGGGISLKF